MYPLNWDLRPPPPRRGREGVWTFTRTSFASLLADQTTSLLGSASQRTQPPRPPLTKRHSSAYSSALRHIQACSLPLSRPPPCQKHPTHKNHSRQASSSAQTASPAKYAPRFATGDHGSNSNLTRRARRRAQVLQPLLPPPPPPPPSRTPATRMRGQQIARPTSSPSAARHGCSCTPPLRTTPTSRPRRSSPTCSRSSVHYLFCTRVRTVRRISERT